MSSSGKVGEIFLSAGSAFNTLGQLTRSLSDAPPRPGQPASGTKWTDEEVEMLHRAIRSFASDLEAITEHIRGRTVGQIKNVLRQKAYEDNGIPLTTAALTGTSSSLSSSLSHPSSSSSNPMLTSSSTSSSLLPPPSADVTLNALNAHNDNEVDVEGLGGGDFGASSP